jgi:hypothetical protein
MKGIAITLATREDGEAVDRIEKLTGFKIARSDGGAPVPAEAATPEAEAPREETKRAPRERSSKRDEPRREKPSTREPRKPREVAEAPQPVEQPRERTPVVEDMAAEWNGPMPSFLSRSAG